MQYLDNFKLSTRDREEYTGHENLYVFTVTANPRSTKSPMAHGFSFAQSAHFFGLFRVSGRVSSR